MVVPAALLARAVGVKEGESTLSVFLGLFKQAKSAHIFLCCTINTPYHGVVLCRRCLLASLLRDHLPITWIRSTRYTDRYTGTFQLVTRGFD
jgi:hypothetical protein